MPRRIKLGNRALTLFTKSDYPKGWADLQDELGNSYAENPQDIRADNLEKAIFHFQQALQVYTREAFAKEWARVHNNLGNAFRERIAGIRADNLEQSIFHFQKALEVYSQQAFPKEWAMVQHNLATTFEARIVGTRTDNLNQAIFRYQEALKVRTQQLFSKEWANTQNNLGVTYHNLTVGNLAENFEKSIFHLQQALKVRTRKVNPEDWAQTQHNLGVVFAKRIEAGEQTKDLEQQAIHHFQQALQVYIPQVFPANHRWTARDFGHLLFLLGRWSEAVDVYRTALEAGETLYQLAATPEARQAELAEIYGLPSRLAFALAHNPDQFQAAVETIERGRAQALAEALALDAAPLDGLTPEDRKAFETVRVHIRDLQAKARLPEDIHGRRDFLTLSQQLKFHYTQLRQVVERIRRYVPEFFPEPTFAEVQAAAQSIPLVYLLVTSAGGLALIVYAGGVWSLRLDVTEDDLEAWLVKQEDEVVVGGYLPGQLEMKGVTPLRETLVEVLPLMGKKIMQPVAAALDDIQPHLPTDQQLWPVVLIPTGLLALLPLHAATYLVNDQERAFLDEYAVTYAPSARALSHSRAAVSVYPNGPSTLFAVGNPLPLPERKQPLAFARTEVEEITSLFDGETTALYETQATRRAVEAGLDTATYVHLACHGQFDPAQPLDSSLILSGSDRLTLRDVLARPPFQAARLVVLSACQTAITDFNQLPDEAVGLPAGFLQAGVPGVIGTLWPVEDLSTPLLMIKFYEYHLRGDPKTDEGPLPPHQALRCAQHWLRKATNQELAAYFNGILQHSSAKTLPEIELEIEADIGLPASADPAGCQFSHPYYWAPFIFVGA
ncbi:MAG: CHAT domain-containing protein [Anaerolineae bacterium]|nr:CHAT domain-containing protein [Anaerolineae bacterium]